MQETIQKLSTAVSECMPADRDALSRRLQGLYRRFRAGKPVDRGCLALEQAVAASQQRYQQRLALLPTPEYPPELPVSAKKDEIAEAIARHQVVVIAGETGSGKTTQIPKICLELGRGVSGMIGHTQPRRLAARSVAKRIAQELKTEVGQAVGFKVRFTDRVSESSYIKLMTDGILLAEIQQDPMLLRYDTIIIDEAHERSLNIDFLLGYLKRLLPQRPDLKLVITSATINTEAFSRFFNDAPVIEVSGRTYPVEVRYRPLLAEDEDDRDRDLPEAIADAVDEAGRLNPLGDILVFLPGEREIREVAETLRKHAMRDTEVIPLFSRLSASEQDQVFKPHRGRRIVLATNVAETSLTVPGIQFVIDSGLARISRYSHRTKVQRLPIEPVSRASANQRAGRCGRVCAGVCIRLYSEEDFQQRPEQTDPEIRRTNLASVILQMASLGLGEVDRFPFMDPPDRRYITDGYRLLHELQAVDDKLRLTKIGRQLVGLPVDPRLGRMLLAADKEGSLAEVLIISAALSVQDPRMRPMDAQAKADQAHREFEDPQSDFISFIKLWKWYHEQARHLSQSKLRKLCHDRYLSYVRLREWHDIHGQLLGLARELGLSLNAEPADADSIHRALLPGLLSHVAMKQEERAYIGARNNKLMIFPGSALFKKPPKWIVAADLVETTRLYARTVAGIDPKWLEPLARHLVKRSYFEPHWEKRPAQVAAYEQVSLYGLPIVIRRRVNYGPIDPAASRELFIRHALVAGEYRTHAGFFAHNRRLVQEVEALEAKSRRRDVMADEQDIFDFYDSRIPAGIYSGKSFESWYRQAKKETPRLLFLSKDDLMRHQAEDVTAGQFPDLLNVDGLQLALEYQFEPGHAADGVTVLIPLAVLGQLRNATFEWLVPGLLRDKLIALIKGLPKNLRRNFVPAVNFADACLQRMNQEGGSLIEVFSHQLLRMTGVEVPMDAWNQSTLPVHLKMNFRIVDQEGRRVAEGRDLLELQQDLAGAVRETIAASGEADDTAAPDIERDGITVWDFGELPEVLELKRHGLAIRGYPALVDKGDSVSIRLFESEASASKAMRAGLQRLFHLAVSDKVKYLRKKLPGIERMCLHYTSIGRCEQLKDDLIAGLVARVFMKAPLPRNEADFQDRLTRGRVELIEQGNRLAALVETVLAAYHDIAKELKGSVAPHRLKLVSDVREQLQHLVFPGFIEATPAQWLEHFPRYLEAVRQRLQKHDRNPERDRQNTLDIKALWDKCQDRPSRQGAGSDEASVKEFRWLIEELRVSLFAQELKTIVPVSVKRLEKTWKEIST